MKPQADLEAVLRDASVTLPALESRYLCLTMLWRWTKAPEVVVPLALQWLEATPQEFMEMSATAGPVVQLMGRDVLAAHVAPERWLKVVERAREPWNFEPACEVLLRLPRLPATADEVLARVELNALDEGVRKLAATYRQRLRERR